MQKFQSIYFYNHVLASNWIEWNKQGNLLGSAQQNGSVNIYDIRTPDKLIKAFPLHKSNEMMNFGLAILIPTHKYLLDWVRCIRWSADDTLIVTSSDDRTAKVTDFKTGNICYSGETSDKGIRC